MITLFAALSAGAKTYIRCNFSIFFFNDLTERLGGCLYKCGCLVKLSILMSMTRKNSFFQSLRACTPTVKGQPFGDFLSALIFWQDIWTHLGQFFFLFCTQSQDDERNMPRKFEDKLSLIKVSKGRCPKALDDFADLSVLCQVGRFTFAFCYQFLMILFLFWNIPIRPY